MTPSELSKILSKGSKTVVFQKADSTIRRMRCTLDPSLIPPMPPRTAVTAASVMRALDQLAPATIGGLTMATMMSFADIKSILAREAVAHAQRNAPSSPSPVTRMGNVKVFDVDVGDWRTIVADRVIAVEDY